MNLAIIAHCLECIHIDYTNVDSVLWLDQDKAEKQNCIHCGAHTYRMHNGDCVNCLGFKVLNRNQE